MVSDGITEADKDDDEAQWLQEILAHVVPQSREGAPQQSREGAAQQSKEQAAQQNLAPRRLAQQILAEAQQRYDCRENDDLTVLVALVESTR